jgi:hypothetical protein
MGRCSKYSSSLIGLTMILLFVWGTERVIRWYYDFANEQILLYLLYVIYRERTIARVKFVLQIKNERLNVDERLCLWNKPQDRWAVKKILSPSFSRWEDDVAISSVVSTGRSWYTTSWFHPVLCVISTKDYSVEKQFDVNRNKDKLENRVKP